MIDDDESPARFERRKQPLVHLGAVDRKIAYVVIVEDDCDEVELRGILGYGIIEGPLDEHEVGLRLVGQAFGDGRAGLR